MQRSESRVQRYAVPKFSKNRVDRRAGRFFINLARPFHETFLGGNRYAMLCVDDFSRFKFIRFLKHKNDATTALQSIIAEKITLAGLKVGIIRTDSSSTSSTNWGSSASQLPLTCLSTTAL